MRDFLCRECGQRLASENSLRLRCTSALGFRPADRAIHVLDDRYCLQVDGRPLERCATTAVAQCNWSVKWTGMSELCASCRFTRTRTTDGDVDAMAEFGRAGTAKRRLILAPDEPGPAISAATTTPMPDRPSACRRAHRFR